MKYMQRHPKFVWLVLTLSCTLLWACGEKKEMGPKEQQAIQIVKAYTPGEGLFSVVSNIEKQAEDNGRKGDKWELGPWEAGLPSQKDRIIETLSQYFNVFRPAGDYWVRFTYRDKEGVHEALWEVNIYSKKVTVKNDVAQKFSTGQS
ncbi:MAG TPA: hypothetical protein VGX03_40020 [Candidatus Binatia bacterium]|nr:hypothetical protein [Candidatus Binatia bacterium]